MMTATRPATPEEPVTAWIAIIVLGIVAALMLSAANYRGRSRR